MGHLPIRLSLVARFEGADKTEKLSRNASALLSFAVPGVEATDKTVKLPPYISAVLSFEVTRFEGADKTVFASQFFRGALAQLRIRFLR